MMLQVKEIFGPTIQGEGETAGRPSIFIRFAGCNMWSGEEHTKEKSMCPFCDTDFIDGTPMSAIEILNTVKELAGMKKYLIVFTGGEPLLQDKEEFTLLTSLLSQDYLLQLETNGSVNNEEALANFDYVTWSPKTPLHKCRINREYVTSFKLLYPHPNPELLPSNVTPPVRAVKYLQPIDGDNLELTTQQTIEMVKELGVDWTLSIQQHKILGEQ